jgi:hypothetical protein
MDRDFEEKEKWYNELDEFVSRWENEVEELKDKKLNAKECTEISKMFHNGEDSLLLRRPVGLSDRTVFNRLETLNNKLHSSLAQALCSVSSE